MLTVLTKTLTQWWHASGFLGSSVKMNQYLVALRCDGLTKEVVVVPILQETPVLLVLPRFLGVGNCEKVVLPVEPVAKAAVLDN